ncbi:MAG: hypothetical protein GY794_11110 [bacterium]|nr:hypothetical protein [bacterium]
MTTPSRRGGGSTASGGAAGGGGQMPSFVKRLDKNGDGKVSKSEFDGPSRHFSVLDKNSDGYLSEDEAPKGPPPGRPRR